MRNIRAGALRTPVYLGKPVILKDNAGGEKLTWNEVLLWALIEPLTGREFLSQNVAKDAVDAKITIRAVPNWIPDARWRIRDPQSTRLYNIVSAMPQPKFGSVECLARTAPGSSDGR